MRRCLPFLLATSSLCALSAEAGAADLRVPMPTKAPPPAAVGYATWTGCYIGANVGYGRARYKYSPTTDPAPSPDEAPDQTADGVVGGGQVGCDYQFDPFVVGIQGMFDGAGIAGTGDIYTAGKGNITGSLRARTPWFTTFTGRAGVSVQNNLLIYVKGGAAWARTNFDFSSSSPNIVRPASADITRTGWTVGVGGEMRLTANLSAFLEYGHLDFGNRLQTFTNNNGGTFGLNVKQEIDLVLIGLNYRFGSGPVVARY
jgi:outer membrane immunogenic protein